MKNIKKLLAQQKSEILPDDKIKDNFNRIFCKNVFESLKSILMKQGYSFQRI